MALIDWDDPSSAIASFQKFEQFESTNNRVCLSACFSLPGITALDNALSDFSKSRIDPKTQHQPSPAERNLNKSQLNSTPSNSNIPPLMSVQTPLLQTPPTPILGRVPLNQHVFQQRPVNPPFRPVFHTPGQLINPPQQHLVHALSNATQISPQHVTAHAHGNQIHFRQPVPANVLFPRTPFPAQHYQKCHHVRNDTKKYSPYMPSSPSHNKDEDERPKTSRKMSLNDPKYGNQMPRNTPPSDEHFEIIWSKTRNKKRWSATRPYSKTESEDKTDNDSISPNKFGFSQKSLLDCLEIKEEKSRLSEYLMRKQTN